MLETIRDIAIILVAVLDIILLGLLAVLVYFVLQLFLKVKGDVPELLDTAKSTARGVKGTTEFVSETAVTPMIRIVAAVAAVGRFIAVLFGGQRSRL